MHKIINKYDDKKKSLNNDIPFICIPFKLAGFVSALGNLAFERQISVAVIRNVIENHSKKNTWNWEFRNCLTDKASSLGWIEG